MHFPLYINLFDNDVDNNNVIILLLYMISYIILVPIVVLAGLLVSPVLMVSAPAGHSAHLLVCELLYEDDL